MKNYAINIQNFTFIAKNILYLYLINHIDEPKLKFTNHKQLKT